MAVAPQARTPEATARSTGKRVVVPQLTTETSQVYANPDGTHTLEQSALPARVRRGDSGWAPVSAALHPTDDGMVTAAAVPVPVAFSGGGDAPLVRFGSPDHLIELPWPAKLPVPAVSGDTAVYTNVLPGVDLKMSAAAQGYSQVLVVKSRAAAPAAIKLGLTVHGLSLRTEPGGGLSAVDSAGVVVFAAPPSRMWDASSKRSAARVAIAGDTLTLTPDRDLLAAPDTVYPVSIDPSFNATRTGWAEVYRDFPTQAYWNGAGDDPSLAKVGLSFDDDVTVRSYFQSHRLSTSAEPVGLRRRAGCDRRNQQRQQGSHLHLAADENDNLAWKKFATNPQLVVTYNSNPGVPAALSSGQNNGPGIWSCGPSGFIATTVPSLHASVSDADGGTVGRALSVRELGRHDPR
jgi:hypothetical protein